MSGGHFDYNQYRLLSMADDIRALTDKGEFPDDIIARFREGEVLLRKAYVYVQRIDWLVSDDDGEDSFRKRLEEDLGNLKTDGK